MLPLVLKTTGVPIAAIGSGDKLQQRLDLLHDSGADRVDVFDQPEHWPSPAVIASSPWRIVYMAGIPDEQAEPRAAAARAAGKLVNVEDVPHLCDFYVPALVRRGNLLLTISTAGTAAGVSKILKEYLAKTIFPESWAQRLEWLATFRNQARAQGQNNAQVLEGMRQHINEQKWLPQ